MSPGNTLDNIPKADMHVHLEATMTPDMMKRIAHRNGVKVPDGIVSADGLRFEWGGGKTAAERLISFVTAYDTATSVMKTARDFTALPHDFLVRAAAENCIYTEPIISADHGRQAGVSYPDMVGAIAEGYARAHRETGIEARFISTFVRHYGVEKCNVVAREIRDYPHPLVVAAGIAGNENAGHFRDFADAFNTANLQNRSVHASEAAGAESAAAALDILDPRRIGHGVRIVEDPAVMRRVKDAGVTLEVCVSSNMALEVFPDYQSHPLRRLFNAGVRVVLGSDDPSFFGTTIGGEYKIAHDKFGFTEGELRQLTRTAIETAFVDAPTRARLMTRLSTPRP